MSTSNRLSMNRLSADRPLAARSGARTGLLSWLESCRGRVVPLCVVAACFLLAPTVALAAAYEIKIATLAPEGSTWMKLMRELDQSIRRETEDQVGLRFYPGGIQGDEQVVLRKIRTGQLQGAGFTGVGLGEIAPSLRVLELPFLFRNEEEVLAVHTKLNPIFEEQLRAAGFSLLGWSEVGFVYLFSKGPIASREQLQSHKVWLWEGDPMAESFLKMVGVSPIPLAVTDVMTSLQTGLISAVYVSPLACIALQWFTRVTHKTNLPLSHAIGAVIVTNDAFQKIPTQHQPTVRRLCQEVFERLRVATIEDNQKSEQIIAESGVQSVTPSQEAAEDFARLGSEVEKNLVGKLYDRALLDLVHAELAAFRAAERDEPETGSR